jgi:hypothetical protein
MQFEFEPLADVDVDDLLALVQNPLVLRHMPLAEDTFDERKCLAWVSGCVMDTAHGPSSSTGSSLDGAECSMNPVTPTWR